MPITMPITSSALSIRFRGLGQLRRRAVLTGSVVAALIVLGGYPAASQTVTGSAAASAAAPERVFLTFNEAVPGGSFVTPRNHGSVVTEQRMLSSGGGTLAPAASHSSRGTALRFPALDASANPAHAVVVVTSADGGDPLQPGPSDFTFGADLALDKANEASGSDDGNNIIQRGNFEDPAQVKLEIDGQHPRCRIKGSAGASSIQSPIVVVPGQWYRMSCRRRYLAGGEQLVLKVATLGPAGEVRDPQYAVASGQPIGEVRFPDAIPFAIGGKTNGSNSIRHASDQFNGLLDDVFVRIR